MPKMFATTKMPRGVLNKYRTRMMTADEAFDVPSPKWARFYALHGWATMVPDEPALEPKRRGRPPRHTAVAAPEKAEAEPEEKPIEKMTRPELKEIAEEMGVELPSGYVSRDELVDLVGAADDDDDSVA